MRRCFTMQDNYYVKDLVQRIEGRYHNGAYRSVFHASTDQPELTPQKPMMFSQQLHHRSPLPCSHGVDDRAGAQKLPEGVEAYCI